MINKDSYWLGLLIGIAFPFVCFGILYGCKFLLVNFFQVAQQFSETKMMFASAAMNVLPIRYFFVAKSLPKIAQGILLITVVLIITGMLAF
jgi:hypothetical protein